MIGFVFKNKFKVFLAVWEVRKTFRGQRDRSEPIEIFKQKVMPGGVWIVWSWDGKGRIWRKHGNCYRRSECNFAMWTADLLHSRVREKDNFHRPCLEKLRLKSKTEMRKRIHPPSGTRKSWMTNRRDVNSTLDQQPHPPIHTYTNQLANFRHLMKIKLPHRIICCLHR
jgi:hypothetical protein